MSALERMWTSECGKMLIPVGIKRFPSDVEYVRADLYDAAIARAEQAERREKALLETNQKHRDDLVLSTSLRRRAEVAEAERGRLREAADKLARLVEEGPCPWRYDSYQFREWHEDRSDAVSALRKAMEGDK